MEMLILRRKKASLVGGARILVGTGVSGSVDASVESVDDVQSLRHDDDILGVTPPMPLASIQLIEPTGVGASAVATISNGAAWGIHAVGATNSDATGKGIKIAVLDTGIKKDHPAFAGVNIQGRNFTSDDETDFLDTVGHGTHCAGTIFGRDVNGTRIGVARGVTDVLIGKVLGRPGATSATLYKAVNWARDNGARIISMSLAFDFVGYREELAKSMHSKQATFVAMRTLIGNVRFFENFGELLRLGEGGPPVLIVAATGNESDRVGNRFNEGAFTLGAAYPAATTDFLSVAAVGQTGDPDKPYEVAGFSNAGATFAGPGVDVVSALLAGGLGPDSGTSMATPHIAGLAALWAQKLTPPGVKFSPTKILDKLKQSSQIPNGLREEDVGFGIPQAP